MAASKAPKHDFAPAWLKIPSNDNGRSSGLKGYDSDRRGGNKRGDYYGPPGPDYGYPLQKQRSLDQYHDGRYNSGKHRHHSADEDFFSPPYPGMPYYNGYNNFDKYGSQYRSQPLFRPQGRGDKYPPPPPSRFGQVNGIYPPYYDPYAFEFFHGDPYYNGNFGRPHNGAGGGGGKRYHHDREKEKYNKNEKTEKEKKKDKEEIDDDFPTLKGEAEKGSDSKSEKPASGVWDKPLKVNTSHQSSTESPQQSPDSNSKEKNPSSTNSSIYKALVPNKGALGRKPSKDSMKVNPLPPGSGGVKSPTPTAATPGQSFKSTKTTVPVILTKEGTRQSPTPAMDIRTSPLVSQPRRLGDKKSSFLRQLKKDQEGPDRKDDDNNCPWLNGDLSENSLMNGLENMQLAAEEDKALSSSLEAEHRLLREMGWNEADYDEECELTEDERKEMERLQCEMKLQRNGMKRTLPKTLSPQHLPQFRVPASDLNESSDSESDLD